MVKGSACQRLGSRRSLWLRMKGRVQWEPSVHRMKRAEKMKLVAERCPGADQRDASEFRLVQFQGITGLLHLPIRNAGLCRDVRQILLYLLPAQVTPAAPRLFRAKNLRTHGGRIKRWTQALPRPPSGRQGSRPVISAGSSRGHPPFGLSDAYHASCNDLLCVRLLPYSQFQA